ncbi:MAG: hypothetical protein HQ581_12030, partial [Planctomycetes bacterium]|nr:hypothetical protein [Planctomycetota bacterium]
MMDDSAKSRDQLVSELGALRRQVAQLRAGGGSQTADPVGPAGVPSLDWDLRQASGSCDVGGVVGTAIDVTQRKKVESELLADRRLMKQLLLAHERDRRLIAYEIHDGLVQDVTGAQMQLEAVLRDERLPAGLVRERVQAASELARKAIGEARHLIGGLRPPALDELGIVAALEFLVGEQSERGTKVDFVACVTF